MNKALVLIIALAMLATAGGCAPNQSAAPSPTTTPQPVTAAPTANASATPTEAQPEYFKKFEPVVTFTQNMVVGADAKWLEGDSVESNPYTRWMESTVGVKFKAAWVSPEWDTDNQKLSIAAASNSLPDVIFSNSNSLSKLIKANQLMPLNELIAEHSSPLVKHLNDINNTYTKGKFSLPFINGGKTYAYAFPYDNAGFWKVNWIRKDLLDELGKQVPQTLQDLEDVMAAYLAKYPNGTAFSMSKGIDMEMVMSGFDAYPGSWQLASDGKLAYGSIQPGIKKGLELLSKWYKAGYIDKEFVAKTGEQTDATFTKGDMLTYKGAWWNMYFPFPDLFKNVATAEMVVMPILKGPDGQQGLMVNAISGMGVAVRKDVKSPEALMYLLNEEMDSFYRSDANMQAAMKSVGYTFKYPHTPFQEPVNKEDANRITDTHNYEVEGWGYFNKASYHTKYMLGFQLSDPSTLVTKNMQQYYDLDKGTITKEQADPDVYSGYESLAAEPRAIKAFSGMFEYWSKFQTADELKVNENVGAPTPTEVSKKALLDTMEKEVFAQIIMGAKPLDAFDKFVSDWKANGGDQWTQEVNDWYASTK